MNHQKPRQELSLTFLFVLYTPAKILGVGHREFFLSIKEIIFDFLQGS